jgi:hypothetical protein
MAMTATDTILETSPAAMLAKVNEGGTIATWSDDKKQDFVDLFNKRSRAAQYILAHTASIIIERARNRYFIGQRLYNELSERARMMGIYDNRSYGNAATIGGRTVNDLNQIAEERAKLILDELPPIKTAVQVIDPDTSKMLDQRDKLLARLKVLKGKLSELPTTISLAEPEIQDMTIREFRKKVKALEKKRRYIGHEMSDVGGEGQELDRLINKRLYNGLPGLSDAVRKVAIQYIERSKALDATTRRVEEKVKFGDDEGAQELLRGFEKDEVTISDNVKAEFAAALDKLNLAKKRKSLGRGKSKRGKKK